MQRLCARPRNRVCWSERYLHAHGGAASALNAGGHCRPRRVSSRGPGQGSKRAPPQTARHRYPISGLEGLCLGALNAALTAVFCQATRRTAARRSPQVPNEGARCCCMYPNQRGQKGGFLSCSHARHRMSLLALSIWAVQAADARPLAGLSAAALEGNMRIGLNNPPQLDLCARSFACETKLP